LLRIHFLNVGNGDCTVVEHPSGRLTVVDINNGRLFDQTTRQELEVLYPTLAPPELGILGLPMPVTPSELAERGYHVGLTNPVDYIGALATDNRIFRYVQTHPDLDHMRGLSAIRDRGLQILNFWDTLNTKQLDDVFRMLDQPEWDCYQAMRSGAGVGNVVRAYADERLAYWGTSPDFGDPGDGIDILSPTKRLTVDSNDAQRWNDLSYVIRIRYAGVSVILGGDAESAAWQSMLDRYGQDLKCDILKASHHGRDSGYHVESVKLMSPQLTVVSVGKKPETDASNKYRQFSQHVWSTRWRGNIIVDVQPDGRWQATSQHHE